MLAAAAAVAVCASILAAGAAAAAGGPGASASIVNGRQAAPGQFPWMAYVDAKLSKRYGFGCTGTVVSPYVVLTAGHCVESPETGLVTRAGAYTVVTGRTDVADGKSGQKLKVARAVVSPRFSPFGTLRGDLGLLILKTPTTAPPIPIAHSADAALSAAGTAATVAGWGLTSERAQKAPTRLRWGTTTVARQSYCHNHVALPPKRYSTISQICTFEARPDATIPCYGDSGGPLLGRSPSGAMVEVGITSYGFGCGEGANVFTRVDRFAGWIDSWIAAAVPGSHLPKPDAGAAQGPRLPTIFEAEASRLMRETLRRAYGRVFVARGGHWHLCERERESRFRCYVQWEHGRFTYFGTVQVYLVLEGQAVAAASRYAVHRVSTACIGPREKLRGCPYTTRRG
jgi:secreted trypsin-like serine protease